jgi:hypothetical protein
LPKGGTPQIGKSWSSVTRTEAFESTVKHTLVGFATVDGTLTAKFDSEGDTKILQMPQSRELEKAKKDASDRIAKMQAKMESLGAAKKNMPPPSILNFSLPTIRTTAVTYVELTTGIVVRTETQATTKTDKPMPMTKTISVVQRFTLK